MKGYTGVQKEKLRPSVFVAHPLMSNFCNCFKMCTIIKIHVYNFLNKHTFIKDCVLRAEYLLPFYSREVWQTPA